MIFSFIIDFKYKKNIISNYIKYDNINNLDNIIIIYLYENGVYIDRPYNHNDYHNSYIIYVDTEKEIKNINTEAIKFINDTKKIYLRKLKLNKFLSN